MIKFFRQIRLNLVETGNTVKYFKYAIGEIILVVIGILIAVQINTWKTDETNKKEEAFYLKKLRQNLVQDTIYLSWRIRGRDITLIRQDSLNEEMKNEQLKHFSNNNSVYHMLTTFMFSPQTSTFDNLISTGKLDLITNQTIVDSLFVYYNELNNIIKQLNESIETYARNTIAPYIMTFDMIENPMKKPSDYGKDVFFENVIMVRKRQLTNLKRSYQTSYRRSNNLMELIDKQIHDKSF